MKDLSIEFGYPPEVAAQLAQIAAHFQQVLGANLRAILLIGSAARGELTYRRHAHGLEVYSDYEFIVWVKRRNRASEKPLDDGLKRLTQGFGYRNPLFHVDYALREARHLRRHNRTLFAFEAKETGIPLLGQDPRPLLPTVTLADLNHADLREILIHRLVAMTFALEPAHFSGHASEAETDLLRYALCRNALDILTIIVPFSGSLIPTYRRRLEALRTLSDASFAPYFDAGFAGFMEACLEGKLSMQFQLPVADLYERTLRYLFCTLRYVLRLPPDLPAEKVLADLDACSPDTFDGHGPWIRHLYELHGFLVRERAPLSQLPWLLRNKRTFLLKALFHFHEAVLTAIRQSPCDLRPCHEALASVSLRPIDEAGDLEATRRALLKSARLIYPYLRKKSLDR